MNVAEDKRRCEGIDRSNSVKFNESRYGAIEFVPNHLGFDDRVRTILQLVRKVHCERILDVGCGDGFMSREFQKMGKFVIGVDASPGAIEVAKTRCDEAFVVDLGTEKLPLPDASVDMVWAGEIVEHIFDTETFIEDLLRVLKPHGLILLSTPNLACWINRISLLFGQQPFFTELGVRTSHWGSFLRKPSNPAGHIRNFTPSGLKHLMESCGCKYEGMKGASIIVNKALSPLDRLISHYFTFLATDLIILCRK